MGLAAQHSPRKAPGKHLEAVQVEYENEQMTEQVHHNSP
jgi:hypothetical protein